MAVLDQLEMADKANSKAVSLSGGQKQRAVNPIDALRYE
jgi:ABC-type polar amino acid transport system ATPase subunit